MLKECYWSGVVLMGSLQVFFGGWAEGAENGFDGLVGGGAGTGLKGWVRVSA
jgi:hypothetical protein